ncbi:MAG: hypothetical protein AAF556_12290 [Pseudomonadota bacterium]
MIDGYTILVYLHLIAFVYWLGGDLGVFVSAKRIADPELSFEERMRWMKYTLAVDMSPRSSLIIMLAIGFNMATLRGLIPLDPLPWAVIVWAICLAWLAIGWTIYLKEGQPIAASLKKIDMPIRMTTMVLTLGAGLFGLFSDAWIQEPWLAAKVFMFGLIIVCGLMLRGAVTYWVKGFGLLRAGDKEEAEKLIHTGAVKGEVWAITLWALLAVIGFIGVTEWWIS